MATGDANKKEHSQLIQVVLVAEGVSSPVNLPHRVFHLRK